MTRFDNAVKVIDLLRARRSRHVAAAQSRARLGRAGPADALRRDAISRATARPRARAAISSATWTTWRGTSAIPDASVTKSPIPINLGGLLPFLMRQSRRRISTPLNGSDKPDDFHPMKGPMTTQTLRGLRNSGAMHWRGDRSTGRRAAIRSMRACPSTISSWRSRAWSGSPDQPHTGRDADVHGLPAAGDASAQPGAQSGQFADRVAEARARLLHGTAALRRRQSRRWWTPLVGQASFTCNGCHALDPSNGSFGTGGNQSFEGLPQIVKIPHLRNLYAKVGMFGSPAVDVLRCG